jgi:hypothetical protein
MKKIILLILSIHFLSAHCQNYRIEEKERTKLWSIDGYLYVQTKEIEKQLAANAANLSGFHPIDTLYLQKVIRGAKYTKREKKIIDNYCFRCYLDEYKQQLQSYQSKEDDKRRLDEQRAAYLKEKRLKEDSIKNANKPVYVAIAPRAAEPYDDLINHLNGIAPQYLLNRYTYFIGLDCEFCYYRINRYLQDDRVGLSVKDAKFLKNKTVHSYVKRVSTADEYLNVIFYHRDDAGKTPYSEEHKRSQIIYKVIIEGTADIVSDIFANYFPCKTKMGGKYAGDIAHHTIMGEYIALSKLSSAVWRITIQKGDASPDHYKNFNIRRVVD